jgi:two-component system cell cycle response regulator
MTQTSKTRRIMIIDDGTTLGGALAKKLEKKSFVVDSVRPDQEYFARLESGKYDLVLADCDGLGTDANEFVRHIRGMSHFVALIVFTERQSETFSAQAFKDGVDDLVHIPFNATEVIARVEARIRGKITHDELLNANSQLKDLAEHDDVSGLFNMRNMYQRIDNELRRVRRYGRPLSCVMLDIDYFKTVNDQNDHLFGTHVLKQVGQLLERTLRSGVDFAARYGGDEFLVVLPETDEIGAVAFSERFRNQFQETDFTDGKNHIKLTVSLGVSFVEPFQEITAKDLVLRADHALYEAKETGRNRSVAFSKHRLKSA